MYPSYRVNWGKIILILLAVGALLLLPYTRRVIFVVLPLGTKPDDLVFIGLLIGLVALILMVIRGAVHNRLIIGILSTLFLSEKPKNVYDDQALEEHEDEDVYIDGEGEIQSLPRRRR